MIPGDPRLVTIGQPFDQVSKKAIGIPAQTHRRGATPQPPVGSRQAEDTMADAVTIKEMETVTLSPEELKTMDAYWRAANYLSVGQIYLLDNPLLEKPLTIEDVKPRLLGHWGTTPGLNFIYVHLNRVIKRDNLSMIYLTGPGHGGPALVANTYLEGSYSELYPDVSQDTEGMKKLFKQFSFPGGIPSHVAPEVPGSIHEGGELGYVVSHAYGAAFDNPDLIVACIVGDGEAETGPLATAWHSNKFLNPARDGAVLPILHLNGYKIANPTIFDRMDRDELGFKESRRRLAPRVSPRGRPGRSSCCEHPRAGPARRKWMV
jgi:xylulose-5-phosphate/fructose-6-phosphate phosphoketolase